MNKRFTFIDFISTLVCVAIAFFGVGTWYGDRTVACMLGLASSCGMGVWLAVRIILNAKWGKK